MATSIPAEPIHLFIDTSGSRGASLDFAIVSIFANYALKTGTKLLMTHFNHVISTETRDIVLVKPQSNQLLSDVLGIYGDHLRQAAGTSFDAVLDHIADHPEMRQQTIVILSDLECFITPGHSVTLDRRNLWFYSPHETAEDAYQRSIPQSFITHMANQGIDVTSTVVRDHHEILEHHANKNGSTY